MNYVSNWKMLYLGWCSDVPCTYGVDKYAAQHIAFVRGYIHTAELIYISLFSINHIPVICFSPGLIVDMAGDYRAGFYMAGAILVLSAGFLIILDRLQQRKIRGSKIRPKPEKSTLPYPSLHILKHQTRKYGEHSVVVWLHETSESISRTHGSVLFLPNSLLLGFTKEQKFWVGLFETKEDN